MNKPLLWINTLSSALHAGLDNVVSEELRATTSNICYWNRARKNYPTGSNDACDRGQVDHAAPDDRKVA
ncbi:MAG: hypothetical protein H7312_14475 [Tardiphaga sp.]|jgi:hypothetical protein|nr:hypothetical protein [Tardiphaga sp.]